MPFSSDLGGSSQLLRDLYETAQFNLGPPQPGGFAISGDSAGALRTTRCS